MECGQSAGATYPCLMLSHTRLERVNILSRSFTIHLDTFYTSDGWDDSLPGSCQTVPESMYIYFLTENPEENGVNGALERGESENMICSRSDDRRKVENQRGGNPIGNLALLSDSSQKSDLSRLLRIGSCGGEPRRCRVRLRCLAGSLVTRGAVRR